jgi:hypothetical protein
MCVGEVVNVLVIELNVWEKSLWNNSLHVRLTLCAHDLDFFMNISWLFSSFFWLQSQPTRRFFSLLIAKA